MSEQIYGIIEIEDKGKWKSFFGSFERPNAKTKIEAIPYMGLITYMGGRTTWDNVKFELFDCSAEDCGWIETWGFMTKKDVVFSLIDREGFVTEKWVLVGAIVNYLEINKLNNYEYRKIVSNKLIRKVLIEKINIPTFQFEIKLEVQIDMANYGQ